MLFQKSYVSNNLAVVCFARYKAHLTSDRISPTNPNGLSLANNLQPFISHFNNVFFVNSGPHCQWMIHYLVTTIEIIMGMQVMVPSKNLVSVEGLIFVLDTFFTVVFS